MSQGSTRPVVAAVDVGGTRIKAGLVHADGALTHDRLVPTPTGLGDTLIPTLTRVASEVVDAGRAQGLGS